MILIAGGIILALGLLLVLKVFDVYKTIYTPKPDGAVTTPAPEKTTYSVLLLGYAGGTHQGTYLTDTMMLITVDLKKKEALLISIPRDIWVKIPTKSKGGFHSKINAVYQMELFSNNYPDLAPTFLGTQKDAALVKHVVSEVTGVPVDYYVAIDFDGFVNVIDILGGVDVQVERTFDDYEYPIEGKENDNCDKKDEELIEAEKQATQEPRLAFPCRYEKIHFDAGPTHMDGKTALKYVRSRHSKEDGGDFGRAQRQQRFLQSLRSNVLSIDFITKILPLLDELKDDVKTDFPPSLIQKVISLVPSSSEYSLNTVILTDKDFLVSSRSADLQYILVPRRGLDNWSEIKFYIKSQQERIPTKYQDTN